jgi:hypothetical protein
MLIGEQNHFLAFKASFWGRLDKVYRQTRARQKKDKRTKRLKVVGGGYD